MCNNRPTGKDETPPTRPQPFCHDALGPVCLGQSPMCPSPEAPKVPGKGRKRWMAGGSAPTVQGGKYGLVEFGLGKIHFRMLIHEPGEEK